MRSCSRCIRFSVSEDLRDQEGDWPSDLQYSEVKMSDAVGETVEEPKLSKKYMSFFILSTSGLHNASH